MLALFEEAVILSVNASTKEGQREVTHYLEIADKDGQFSIGVRGFDGAALEAAVMQPCSILVRLGGRRNNMNQILSAKEFQIGERGAFSAANVTAGNGNGRRNRTPEPTG